MILYLDSERSGELLVNQRLAYVALSRGRYDAAIYTDDHARLSDTLSREVSHPSAIEPRRNPAAFATEPARGHVSPHERDPSRSIPHGPSQSRATDRRRDAPERNVGAIGSHDNPSTETRAGRGFSDSELREARAYLQLPASRAYLRARHETEKVRSGGPARETPAALEPRHVAAVLRSLPPHARGQDATSVAGIKQTPAVILRAAETHARAERVSGTGQAVAARAQVGQRSVQQSTGHSAGQSNS